MVIIYNNFPSYSEQLNSIVGQFHRFQSVLEQLKQKNEKNKGHLKYSASFQALSPEKSN